MNDFQRPTDSTSYARPKGITKVISEFLLRYEGTKYTDIDGVSWTVISGKWELLPKGDEYVIDPTNIV